MFSRHQNDVPKTIYVPKMALPRYIRNVLRKHKIRTLDFLQENVARRLSEGQANGKRTLSFVIYTNQIFQRP